MRIARLMAAGGSSGIYLDRLFERWGIAPQVRAKAVLVPVGPLPAEIQNYTVHAGTVGGNEKGRRSEGAAGGLARPQGRGGPEDPGHGSPVNVYAGCRPLRRPIGMRRASAK
jgi:hypothetical protein